MNFEDIILGKVHSFKIAENDLFLAILEKSPLAKGHTLVIPKKRVESIFSMENRAYSDMQIFAKKVALKLETVINCRRIGMAVIGLEVAYAHIHLIPLQTVEDINFTKEKLVTSDDELREVYQQIISLRKK